jgi:gas vesicle protein
MEGNSTSSVRTITLLFIGGAVLGTVAGMLLAPKAGRETRRELKHYAIKVKKDVASTAQRTKAGIEAALEKGRALLTESKAA